MDKIGKYEVLEKIGAGGFGVVFKGRDPFIKRFVAIKTCSSEAEDVRRRFYREAEIAGNLQHRNVVTVYDFGEQDEVPYLVQEYLPGEDLDQLILARALTDDVKLDYLLQIATGLQYAHAQGVIHRDIKPSNVRVMDGGRVKIMDFGIAKLANLESQLTKTGMTLGTASYLAPEQIRGEDLTHAADIFSFGVLAYELFAHRRPFEGQSLSNLFYQILSAEPPPLDSMAAGCPPELAAIVQRCLDKDPAKRWRDCGELLAALEPLRDVMATAHEAERTQVLGGIESGPTASLTAAARELATVEAKVGDLLAAGDATAAEIEVTLARKRFAATPQAAQVLGALGERIAGERGRRDEQRRQAEKLDAFVARGRELLRAGEHAEAALVLRAALDVDPAHRDAAALLDEVEAAAAAADRARQDEEERRRREEEALRRQVAEAVGEVDALIAGGDLRAADRAWRRASTRLGDRPEVAAARERLEGARAAAEAEAAAREQVRLEAARAAAAEKAAARERARAEAEEQARQKREAAERAAAEREAARQREREEAAALASARAREKAEAARLAAEERARQKAEATRLEEERQARLRAEREARDAEEARRQEEVLERKRAAAATALGGGAGAVGEESAAYSVGARGRWRWAVVAAAALAAVALLGLWWSGARGGASAEPIAAAAEPASVPAEEAIPPQGGAEVPPGPAVDPPPVDPVATPAALVPPGAQAPAEPPADAGLDAATRTLLANGRRALARGDVAAALAPAQDAWRRAGDDPDVQALTRDLTAAAGRAAVLAQRDAAAAGAGELAARQAAAAAKARSEGDRLAMQPGPAGAQALWRSAVLYRGAAQAAREEGERRERARQEEARRAEAAPPPPPAPTTPARQQEPPARTDQEPRPAAPPPAPRPVDESAGVEAAIGRYRAASEALDAGALQAVWPSAPAGTLRRSFANYESLRMRVTGCEVQVQGGSANAVCWRDQEVRLKAGRSPDPTRQRVRFRLRRAGDGWLIDSLEAL